MSKNGNMFTNRIYAVNIGTTKHPDYITDTDPIGLLGDEFQEMATYELVEVTKARVTATLETK